MVSLSVPTTLNHQSLLDPPTRDLNGQPRSRSVRQSIEHDEVMDSSENPHGRGLDATCAQAASEGLSLAPQRVDLRHDHQRLRELRQELLAGEEWAGEDVLSVLLLGDESVDHPPQSGRCQSRAVNEGLVRAALGRQIRHGIEQHLVLWQEALQSALDGHQVHRRRHRAASRVSRERRALAVQPQTLRVFAGVQPGYRCVRLLDQHWELCIRSARIVDKEDRSFRLLHQVEDQTPVGVRGAEDPTTAYFHASVTESLAVGAREWVKIKGKQTMEVNSNRK